MSEISCEEVLAEVEDYLHGELDPDRALVLADHLRTCTPCGDRADFALKLKEIVRMKCRSQATPEHLVVRIRQSIRRTVRGGPPEDQTRHV